MVDVRELLKRRKMPHTFNRKKMMLGRSKMKFAGHITGTNGDELDRYKIEAVNRFPTPATPIRFEKLHEPHQLV